MSLNNKLKEVADKVFRTNSVKRVRRLLGSESGVKMISAISFLESALPLPILTDPFLVAAILANRANVVRLVAVATTMSLLGGILAYASAYVFFDTMLLWMSPAVVDEFYNLVASSDSSTFVLTFVGAVTPVPYTIVSWVVAVLKGGILAFIVASFLGRGIRYSIVGYCTYKFGAQAIIYTRKYIGFITVAVFVAAGLFFWLKM